MCLCKINVYRVILYLAGMNITRKTLCFENAFQSVFEHAPYRRDGCGMWDVGCRASCSILICQPVMHSLSSGAWPVLIDEFVEYARPIVCGKKRGLD